VAATVALDREVEDTAATLLRFDRGACAMVAVTNAASGPSGHARHLRTHGSIRTGLAERRRPDRAAPATGSASSRTRRRRTSTGRWSKSSWMRCGAMIATRPSYVTTGRAVAAIQDEIYADATTIR
jgi:hypothetical protein